MREIKFMAILNDKTYQVEALSNKYKINGYVKRKVTEHPFADKRGYVVEHRLIVEENLGKFLDKNAVIHHINRVRDDNRIENLEIIQEQSRHAKSHDTGKRNPNGRFVATEPIFDEIKIRLFNKNTGMLQTYTLSKLIGTTFRKSQFEFRGRYTGLKDKNGTEIYEGDIIRWHDIVTADYQITFNDGVFCLDGLGMQNLYHNREDLGKWEVIGNIYANAALLEDTHE